ncbi:MAG: AAA family ATPase [Halofilum sp. (in: g-proteobacteria)]
MDVQEQHRLVEALRDPGRYPHPADHIEHCETHISHVLLAGDFAYKLKKPLNLGFLDFTELTQREHYCREELRLNARLAPIYLDVVAITGTPDDPQVAGAGEVIEWAVKMRRFDESSRLDHQLGAGRVSVAMIEGLARRVAACHHEAHAADPARGYGTPEAVAAPMRENFDQIRPALADPSERDRLERLGQWTKQRLSALEPIYQQRLATGHVRECHGDMHLANMIALDNGEVAVFDGIEFNTQLRWIDVASEIAFAVMDLDCRDAPALASRFLDQWLAITGDYAALSVFPPYAVYRAMVRAKTTAIRLGQDDTTPEEARALGADLASYLHLGERYARASAPAVAITRGIAGTGKSTAAAALIERHGAIRLRADVERRRLSPDPDPAVRYSQQAHDRVYTRLEDLARQITEAGFPVVIDATFIEHHRRVPFERLAGEHGLPFCILDMHVPLEVLEQRIVQRQQTGNDPSEADVAVMHRQRERLEPLSATEREAAVTVDNSGESPIVPALGWLHARGLDAAE